MNYAEKRERVMRVLHKLTFMHVAAEHGVTGDALLREISEELVKTVPPFGPDGERAVGHLVDEIMEIFGEPKELN